MSILAEAIELQDVELVRDAIAAGEDVNEVVEGLTCLWAATSYHNVPIAELLLAAGADPNVRETERGIGEGTTAIYWAACANDLPMVHLLRSYGAMTNIASADGSTMLHEASSQGYSELLEWLLQTEAVEAMEARDAFECTPLGWAAENGHVECARLLIEAGADVNAIDPHLCCRTPLTRAVRGCHLDVVALLVSHGADPTISGCRCHACPLEEAREWKRHPELLELLVRRSGPSAPANPKWKDRRELLALPEEEASRQASSPPSKPPTRQSRLNRRRDVRSRRRHPAPADSSPPREG